MSAPAPPPLQRARRHTFWLWLATLALAFLLHPYRGVYQDGRIYIGRAMADLDPGGVGSDLMYANDAQTDFSLFPRLAMALVRALGPESASMLISATSLGLWAIALILLTRRLAAGRLGWAAAAAVLALPAGYGAYDAFGYAEAWATPRALAEGASLAGLAAVLAGRWRSAVAALAAAALMHPLMALPAAAVALAIKGQEDRRWLLVFPAGAAGLAAAALAGLPMAERLLEPVDPAWLEALRLRSTYLFPDLWPRDAWSQIGLQLATVLLAARYLESASRRLMLAVAAVAAAGVVAAAIGAAAPSLLVLQLQPWRCVWLLAVMGNAGLLIALHGLWRGGGLGRLAIPGLVCAWLALGSPIGAALGGAVLLLVWVGRDRPTVSGPVIGRAAALAAALLAAIYVALRGVSLAGFLTAAKAAGVPPAWHFMLAPELHGPIIAALALIWALRPVEEAPPRRWGAAIAALILLAAALWLWDSRTAAQRALESGQTARAFAAAGVAADGEVYWADGEVQPWFVLGRPQWVGLMQGGPMLYSRDLALRLGERTRTVLALGLGQPRMRAPFLMGHEPMQPIRPPPSAIDALCRRQDGPSAIVLPGRQREAAGATRRATVVTAPAADLILADGATFGWARVDAYTVIACR